MKKHIQLLFVSIFLFVGALQAQSWEKTLSDRLPFLGHRNWIVLVDAAYPAQISPGVETILCDVSPDVLLSYVMNRLNEQKHLRPEFFMDKELAFISETDAPGISAYRNTVQTLLSKATVETMLHESIISMLDEAGKTFKVLVLKTPFTLPYSSIFIRLNCGYWNDASEKRLRNALKGKVD